MTGLGKRISCAFRSFFSILIRGEIPAEILRELGIYPAPFSSTTAAAP